MKITHRMRYLVDKEKEFNKIDIYIELALKRILKNCLKLMSASIRKFYRKLDDM